LPKLGNKLRFDLKNISGCFPFSIHVALFVHQSRSASASIVAAIVSTGVIKSARSGIAVSEGCGVIRPVL
ncbi:MAG: hypothetical protein ABI439_12110, partial [Rhodospirillales bacterium]